MKIPTQLRQCILADFDHLGGAAAQCILLPFVAGTRRATQFFIAYGRYDWLILLRFIDKSELLIVVPSGPMPATAAAGGRCRNEDTS